MMLLLLMMMIMTMMVMTMAMPEEHQWGLIICYQGEKNSSMASPDNITLIDGPRWGVFKSTEQAIHLLLYLAMLNIVGVRTPAMLEELLVLPRMSPACSVVVVAGGGGGGGGIGGVASVHFATMWLHSFFLIRLGTKNHQMGCVFLFLRDAGSKKTP